MLRLLLLISDFSKEIDTIQKNKKGVAEAAKKFAEELIKNPILPYEEGEDRLTVLLIL